MTHNLTNKVAFITGGGTWIGKEIAILFARAGAKVFVIGRNKEKLKLTVEDIKQAGGSAAYQAADISNEVQVAQAVSTAVAEFGRIDILVQNAGIYPSHPLDKMTLHDWQQVIDINLTGSFIVLKQVMEFLKKQSQGRVIFISSIAGEEIGLEGLAHYSASKAGMNGLMRTAALELAKNNITVNSIDPGNIINTEIFKVSDDEIPKMLLAIPLKRLGRPDDVANLALFLASDESSFITGQNIIIDGGETII